MVSDVVYRTYTGGDEAGVVDVWNAAMPYDTVDMPFFARRVLCDANFQPQGLQIAMVDDSIVGFALAIERRLPMHGTDLEPDNGWVTALAVHPHHQRQGIGTALLERAESFLKERGKTAVFVSSYAPNYFWPGVDVHRYAGAYELLQSRGYSTLYTPVSMDRNLVHYVYPDDVVSLKHRREEEGYRFVDLTWDRLVELHHFATDRFNPDWGRAVREAVANDLPFNRVKLALAPSGRLVGFALFGGYDGILERFGPFGVDEGERGKGLGKIVLHETLRAMKSHGLHGAWFLWTGEQSAAGHLYLSAGFAVSRTFHVMKKTLG